MNYGILTQPPVSSTGGYPAVFEHTKLLTGCTQQPRQTAVLCAHGARMYLPSPCALLEPVSAPGACVCSQSPCACGAWLHTSQAPFSGKCSSRSSAKDHEQEQSGYPIYATLAWVLVWANSSQKAGRCKKISLLLLCMRAKSLQSCPTLHDSMDCSPPGSSVHNIFSGKNTGVGWHFLLQGIFPTQVSNSHLLCLLCWQVLYH